MDKIFEKKHLKALQRKQKQAETGGEKMAERREKHQVSFLFSL